MNETPDFIANIHYLNTEQGGRKTAAFTGYFPQVKFSFSKYQGGGRQNFIDKEIVNPGDDVTAEITLLLADPFKASLEIGAKFDVIEGARVVGIGLIIEILNKDLLAE